MDTALIFKVVGIGLLVSVSCQILNKSGRDEQAMMTSLAGVVIVLVIVVQQISNLFDVVKTTFGF